MYIQAFDFLTNPRAAKERQKILGRGGNGKVDLWNYKDSQFVTKTVSYLPVTVEHHLLLLSISQSDIDSLFFYFVNLQRESLVILSRVNMNVLSIQK